MKLYFLSAIILLFIFETKPVIADLSQKDLIEKFDKAASNIIGKIVRPDMQNKGQPPLLFYAPYKNLRQVIIPKTTFDKFNSILQEKLTDYGKNKLMLVVSKNKFVTAEQNFKKANFSMITEIYRHRQEGIK